MIGVPFLMCSVSGSKSQFRSGVPAAALANKSDSVVNAPSVTLLQNAGPSAALKVAGSHSSSATTWAGVGELFCAGDCVAPTNRKPPASKLNLAKMLFIVILSFLSSNSLGALSSVRVRWRIVAEALISNNSERLKNGLILHENCHHEEAGSGGIMPGSFSLGCARYVSEYFKA